MKKIKVIVLTFMCMFLVSGIKINVYAEDAQTNVENSSMAENEFTDKKSAAIYLRKQMVAREENITLIFHTSTPDEIMEELYEMAIADGEKGDASAAKEGDYLKYAIVPDTIKMNAVANKATSSYTFSYALNYYTNAEKEKILDEKVAQILEKFKAQGITSTSSEYDRAKAVYDYIVQNVTYSRGEIYDTGKSLMTAYDCLVENYANSYGQLLGAYRLLKELEIPARRVTGTVTTRTPVDYEEKHDRVTTLDQGWLIVHIGDKWYNFDVTSAYLYHTGVGEREHYTYKHLLSAGVSDFNIGFYYGIFTRESKTFVRDEEYLSETFLSSHPMAEKSWGSEPNEPDVDSCGTTFESANARIRIMNYFDNADVHEFYARDGEEGEFVKCYESQDNYGYCENISLGEHKYYLKIVSYNIVNGHKYYSKPSSVYAYSFVNVGCVKNLQCTFVNYDTVTLTWEAVEGADFYNVWRSDGDESLYRIAGTVTTNSYTNANPIASEKDYYYKVQPCRYNNPAYFTEIRGGFSNVVKIHTTLPAPTNVKLKNNGSNAVTVSWTPTEGKHLYDVYWKRAGESKYSSENSCQGIDGTSKVIDGLEAGVEYTFQVRTHHVNASGSTRWYSKFTKAKNIVTPLNTPTSVKASRNSYNSVKVTWGRVNDATYYQLWRSTSPNGNYLKVGTYTANKLNGISKSLACGTKYYYKVRAYKVVNGKAIYSNYSKVVSATPTLSAPKLTAKRRNSSSINVSWNKVDGATYYQVYRATSEKGKYTLLSTMDAKSTSKISKSLKTGRKYYYKVRAYRWQNGKRVYSNFSKVVSARP